jgi:hypothetical protein
MSTDRNPIETMPKNQPTSHTVQVIYLDKLLKTPTAKEYFHIERMVRLSEIKKVNPRAMHPWTADEDARLVQRFTAGTPISKLAEEFQRTPGAIRSRVARLWL